MLDTISSLGSADMRMDEWGVDVVIGGSQKGLMLPTGLAFVAASEKARALSKTAKRKLRKAKSVVFSVKVTATDANGNASTKKRSITIKDRTVAIGSQRKCSMARAIPWRSRAT